MRAGKLRHRMTIQREVETRDSTGAATFTWQDVGNMVWGSINPRSGTEPTEDSHRVTTQVVDIRLRADPGLFDMTAKHRVLVAFDGVSIPYNITAINPEMYRGAEIHLVAQTVDRNG